MCLHYRAQANINKVYFWEFAIVAQSTLFFISYHIWLMFIVAIIKHKTFIFLKEERKKCYLEKEYIIDVKSILGKWKDPSLNEINQHIQDFLEMNFLTVRSRMMRHESRLQDLKFVKFYSYKLLLHKSNLGMWHFVLCLWNTYAFLPWKHQQRKLTETAYN